MTCKKYNEETMFSYAAGELDAEMAQEVKEHIETCGDCRKTYEECRTLLSDVKESGKEVPAELLAGVMAKVRAEKKPKHIVRKTIALVAACAAILVFVFAVSLNVGKSDEKSGVPELMADEQAQEKVKEESKPKEIADPDLEDADDASAGAFDTHGKSEMCVEDKAGEYEDVCEIYCPYHTEAYHNIPRYLIAYVGDAAYEEWRTSLEETGSECSAVKLFDFIVYFDISADVLRECYVAEGLEDEWDIEALCTRDAAKWEAFCGKNG